MPVADQSFNPSGSDVVDGIKGGALALEQYIVDNIPEGRRRSIALTKLEDFSMWAVKAAVVGDN